MAIFQKKVYGPAHTTHGRKTPSNKWEGSEACRALGQQPARAASGSHLRWKEAHGGG